MIDPFPLLLAGHAVGDWIVQTDWQAAGKGWPRPASEWQAALDAVGIDVMHPDPHTDRARAALSWQRRRSWRANQAHVRAYHFVLMAFLFPWVLQAPDGNLNGGKLILAMAFSWLAHSVIDRRWPVRWLLEHTGSARFAETPLGMLAADQALHIATLALMSAWLQWTVR